MKSGHIMLGVSLLAALYECLQLISFLPEFSSLEVRAGILGTLLLLACSASIWHEQARYPENRSPLLTGYATMVCVLAIGLYAGGISVEWIATASHVINAIIGLILFIFCMMAWATGHKD
jgi:hypothetical protein